jgi:hypothetical protein
MFCKWKGVIVYVLDYYVFTEYGIEMIAILMYSAIDQMKGCYGIVILTDTHTTSRTATYKDDGIAIGELMNLCISMLLEERTRREQH